MLSTLVKTQALAVDGRRFAVRYFEVQTPRGHRRYTAEILLGPSDRCRGATNAIAIALPEQFEQGREHLEVREHDVVARGRDAGTRIRDRGARRG